MGLLLLLLRRVPKHSDASTGRPCTRILRPKPTAATAKDRRLLLRLLLIWTLRVIGGTAKAERGAAGRTGSSAKGGRSRLGAKEARTGRRCIAKEVARTGAGRIVGSVVVGSTAKAEPASSRLLTLLLLLILRLTKTESSSGSRFGGSGAKAESARTRVVGRIIVGSAKERVGAGGRLGIVVVGAEQAGTSAGIGIVVGTAKGETGRSGLLLVVLAFRVSTCNGPSLSIVIREGYSPKLVVAVLVAAPNPPNPVVVAGLAAPPNKLFWLVCCG